MFHDWIDQYHRSNFFSGWLEWNATALQAWNTLLVPWMGSPLFTQALSGVMENYLAMYKAMGLQERNERIDMVLPPGVGQSSRTLVWTKNKARLYRYDHSVDAPIQYRTPLLLVYALINKPYILDLLPGRSFIEYLVKHGVDVYLLDWGIPDLEDKQMRFDDLVIDYLPPAIQQVCQTSGQEYLNLFGYCIGGVLITLYTATHPHAPVNSLILLATPIDFGDAGLLSTWLAPSSFDVDNLVNTMGNIQPGFINSGANLLNVVGTPAFLRERAEDERFLEVWWALRFWGMDGVPFPGEAFRQWIKDFYQGNKLINNQLTLAGQRVHLSNITTPLMTIAAGADHLVPLQQIEPTLQAVSSTEKELFILPGSHFGLVTSPRAIDELWPRVLNWLAKHSLVET